MKRLLLVRHAKSDKHNSNIADFDRPLNNRGIKAASLVGSFAGGKKIQPELVISSPAERARQTATLFLKAARINANLRFDERIYEASSSDLLEVVKQIDEATNLALLVGHNPGFEDLQSLLSGHVHNMPTASLAYLNLDIENWIDARAGCAKLEWMISPKELEQD